MTVKNFRVFNSKHFIYHSSHSHNIYFVKIVKWWLKIHSNSDNIYFIKIIKLWLNFFFPLFDSDKSLSIITLENR